VVAMLAATPQAAPAPADLHPATADLVARFGAALAAKLSAAEKKYGYSDGWRDAGWMDECRAKLMKHVAKGDPLDVAAYCAFLWHHGESTAAAPPPITADQEQAMQELSDIGQSMGDWGFVAPEAHPASPEQEAAVDAALDLFRVPSFGISVARAMALQAQASAKGVILVAHLHEILAQAAAPAGRQELADIPTFAWAWIPSEYWRDWVISGDAKLAAEARACGLEVVELIRRSEARGVLDRLAAQKEGSAS
jgi:hypothetical protein